MEPTAEEKENVIRQFKDYYKSDCNGLPCNKNTVFPLINKYLNCYAGKERITFISDDKNHWYECCKEHNWKSKTPIDYIHVGYITKQDEFYIICLGGGSNGIDAVWKYKDNVQ